jgi:NADPH-dependent 2,4-dienoyl-CoA reductase/sulfur reductase-like enzyme
MPKPNASRKVLIVGGGPGGMQAAIDAADRGHQVILADNADRLGGTLRLTDNDFFKKDLCRFKNLLVREVENRNIELRLDTHITPKDIQAITPDALILAIGAEPCMPSIPGIENAVSALDVYFKPEIQIGPKVVMIGGGLVGCEVGLELSHMGKSVTIVEMMERLVANFIGIHRTALLDEMDKYGMQSLVNVRCKKIQTDGVIIEDGKDKETFIAADTVVLALGMKARRAEVDVLRAAAGRIPVFEIGDCVQAAKVGEAIQQGYMAAMSIV